MSMHDHQEDRPKSSFLTSRAGIVLLAFLAMGGFLLFTEHRAHVLGAFIYVLPFACLLMHFGMHGGHGHSGHGHGGHQRDRRARDEGSPS